MDKVLPNYFFNPFQREQTDFKILFKLVINNKGLLALKARTN